MAVRYGQLKTPSIPKSNTPINHSSAFNMYTVSNGEKIEINTDFNQQIEIATNNVLDALTVSTCEAAAQACEAAAESAENASKSAVKLAGRMMRKYAQNDEKIKQSQIQMAEVIAEAAVATATAAKLGAKVCRIGNKAITQKEADKILNVVEDEDTEELLNKQYVDSDDELTEIIENTKRKRNDSASVANNVKKNIPRSTSVISESANVLEPIVNVNQNEKIIDDKIIENIIDPISKQVYIVKDTIDDNCVKTTQHIVDAAEDVNDGLFIAANNAKDILDDAFETSNVAVFDKFKRGSTKIKRRGLYDVSVIMEDAIVEFKQTVDNIKNETINSIEQIKLNFMNEIDIKKQQIITSTEDISNEHVSKIMDVFKKSIDELVVILNDKIENCRLNINELTSELNNVIGESEDGITIMKSEIKTMLLELDTGSKSFNQQIKTIYTNYEQKIIELTEKKFNETLEMIKLEIKQELDEVDKQLITKFNDFNKLIDDVVESTENNKVARIKLDLNVLLDQFKSMTNFDVILKKLGDLISDEFKTLQLNGSNLTTEFKTEIKNIALELKEELKLVISNSKSKLKLYISEFEKIILTISQKKDEFVEFIKTNWLKLNETFSGQKNNFIENITNWLTEKKTEFDNFIEQFDIKKRGLLDESINEIKELLIIELDNKYQQLISRLDDRVTNIENNIKQIKNNTSDKLKSELNANINKFKTEHDSKLNKIKQDNIIELSELKKDLNNKILKLELDNDKLKKEYELFVFETNNKIKQLQSEYNIKIESLINQLNSIRNLSYRNDNSLNNDLENKIENINDNINELKKVSKDLNEVTKRTNRTANIITRQLYYNGL
jgi:hypothetical protein